MALLKKKEVNNPSSKDKIEKNTVQNNDNIKLKKRKRIGFGIKTKEKKENKKKKKEKIKKDNTKSKTPEENNSQESDKEKQTNILSDDLLDENEKETDEKNDKKEFSTKKKKKILTRDMKGKPVYLQDTGEKLGIVYDMMYDGEKNLIGYKIKDNKTDSVLGFPLDQFDEGKEGLIFIQSWYTRSLKIIEQLEFKERVSPELTTLISDDEISNEELYNIFVKHDDQMANYIEEAVALKELLNNRLKALQKQRLALKDDLMNLTEKRLIKDIDRREFSEDVMKHRYKVNVLDVNINRCKELINRLDKTSFGRLSLQIVSNIDKPDIDQLIQKKEEINENNSMVLTDEIKNPYKQKYNDIKERFDQLQEEYNELKSAVEKLVEKGDI